MIKYRSPYEQSYQAAKMELKSLSAEEKQLDQRLGEIRERITALEGMIKALEPLVEEGQGQEVVNPGLTQICRNMLEESNGSLTAQQVRDKLALMGVSLDDYTNPMAVLHTILKRVGEVHRGGKGKKETYYSKRPTKEPPY